MHNKVFQFNRLCVVESIPISSTDLYDQLTVPSQQVNRVNTNAIQTSR